LEFKLRVIIGDTIKISGLYILCFYRSANYTNSIA
jgi:hypothetical protein